MCLLCLALVAKVAASGRPVTVVGPFLKPRVHKPEGAHGRLRMSTLPFRAAVRLDQQSSDSASHGHLQKFFSV